MYAIFKSGGKQHRVSVGQNIKIEKLKVEENTRIEFDEVLMIGTKVGTPLLEGAKIKATVLNQGRHKKINIMKFKRRKHHEKQMGHRQYYTEVKIDEIVP